ncbi:pitrilysin family protein [Marivirga atlantica]|jgi:zinc protease|uniref:Insulinase family protein n=1 Tax=Marivirga atlantica TaxID=1548457 RepID=A0A937DJC3_9BACT|nr:pitrilysin family protein [Marivirga atlantica]MBL0764749.1 insulinase family protein [Marivirga atlantica]
MKKILFVLFAFISTTAFSQTKLIEKVPQVEGKIVIPYEKYELDNGLTLIIHEDHSDPVVHVDVTYHVGSAREELNKSGFAHFFEHMMFQGSENVADEEHFKLVTESGGRLNGTTNRDRTNYFETVPSNQLDRMLWLEADRMGFLLPAVTQEKFEVQRATVKNEKGQNYNNRPYGLFREVNAASLYPYGHPYSWLTIGKLEDLDRVDVTDLKKFFLRWYGPNNATLTVGGDVDPEEVIKKVEKYFGSIPSGPEVDPMALKPVTIDEDRYVSYVDSNIRFPLLLFTYPTVPRFHEDEAALDCLSEILGAGKSSYFYKKFVLTQKAIQASTFHPTSELAGEFTMFTLPFPGQKLADFENEVREILKDFEENGVTDADIEKFKANYESNTINGLASVSGKVSQLASYETFRNDPNYIQKDLDRYLAVTKEDVIRVFNKYIKGKPAVIQSVLPNDQVEPAAPDNYEPKTEGENPFPTTDYSGLSYNRPDDGKYDRSKKPVPGQSPLVKVPTIWNEKWSNGMKIIGTESNEIPTVAIQLTLNGGHQLDANDPTKSGLASLTASMMNEGTTSLSSEEFQEELRKIGSSVSFYAGQNSTVLSINTLVKNLDRTLELAEDALMNPRFDSADFARNQKQTIEGIKSNETDPSSIASFVYDKLIYGDNHIFSVPSSGLAETVENITLDDVKSFYKKYYSPKVGELVVVGDVSKEDILPKLSFLKSWTGPDVKMPSLTFEADTDKTKIYLVDKKDAAQSQIRIGYLTDMTYDPTGETYKAYLMNYNLGGAFNSRINLKLREEKGWTYGARSYFETGENPGPFTASAGVKADATDSSVYEFMTVITDYRENGVTPAEVDFMKKSIGQQDALNYETPRQKAGFLRRIVHYDLDEDYVKEQMKILNKITKKELDQIAKDRLKTDQMVIVVVGDEASNIEGLRKLGYEIVKLNAKGEPVEGESMESGK